MPIVDTDEPALLDDLVEIVTEMLDGIMEASVPDGHVPRAGAHENKTAEAIAEIHGDQPCWLTIRLQASIAIGLAAIMTEENPDDLGPEDACGMLSELTNILGGSVKSLLEEETSLGIPGATVQDTDRLVVLDGSVLVDHPLGVLEIRLGDHP